MSYGDCSYCNRGLLCEDDKCVTCFNKSFASIEMSKYLLKRNKLSARQIPKHSDMKCEFNCPYCPHVYVARIAHVTNGAWCGCRKKKTETKLLTFLTSDCNEIVERQKYFPWCMRIRYLPFDFLIDLYRTIIESDGSQHFKQVLNWEDYKIIQEKDVYKMKCANDNGYSVIRISQVDVWHDKNNWEDNLKLAIMMTMNANYSKKPIDILIGKIYLSHSIYEINDYLHLI